MSYRYQLKQNALTDSYTYKGVNLTKTKWHISETKLNFPAMFKKYIVEENIDKVKKVNKVDNKATNNNSNSVISFSFRDYTELFNYWTTPVYDKELRMKINRTLSVDLAKMYIMLEQQMVQKIGLIWNETLKVYQKNMFLRKLTYNGYNKELVKWEFSVYDLLTNNIRKFSFEHFNEMEQMIQDIINSKVIL
jgi:hypothetical protein